MSREVTEAHYLHERSGLEPVLRPPVQQPIALAWVKGREELIVATRDGELINVDPVLGTRVIMSELGEVATLALNDDRKHFVTVGRNGFLTYGTLRGEVVFREKHDFLAQIQVVFAGKFICVVGDEADGRVLRVFDEAGNQKVRARLPERCAVTNTANGGLMLCRSIPAGLLFVPFGKDAKFPKDESTIHKLRPTRSYVLGFTNTGIAVWDKEGGQPRSMRMPDLTAGDASGDGVYLGLGTRNGAVALARVDSLEKRVHPDLVRAFNAPVTSVAFSDRGRWLATGAEGLRLWSWED